MGESACGLERVRLGAFDLMGRHLGLPHVMTGQPTAAGTGKFWVGIVLVLLSSAFVIACGGGLSDVAVQQKVDSSVATAIAAMPSVPTPAPTSTVVPTATPVTPPTPQPPATPQPTATPRAVPTPQPTSTPQPTALLDSVYKQSYEGVFLIATPENTGTAFLFESDLLLTNQHVVTGNKTVKLWGTQGDLIMGTVIASDVPRDLALIRINPGSVSSKPITLASTINNSSIAEPLIALGYSNTVANGGDIGPAGANVGVLTRVVLIDDEGVQGFEMDAPVDPGDSGGPVLNLKGEVIGINRAVVVETITGQRVVGTFLAIAIDEVHDSLPDMRAGISR